MDLLKRFLNLSYSTHSRIGVLLRVIFLLYGMYHDSRYVVPYTDIDYQVFTDAAKYVYNGESPYKKHTYRYSPLLAMILTPNVFLDKTFGKKLFCVFDMLNAILLKKIVENQTDSKNARQIATYCSLFWIYNPMSIAISTRGNADSLPCFVLIISILFLQLHAKSLLKYILSGVFLGLAIHLRLYPVFLSLPMYLSLGEYKIHRNTQFIDAFKALMPNTKQITLTLSCVFTFISLSYFLYIKYGYDFLFETYIYHFIREDTRHNFSVFFYYAYLTKDEFALDMVKIIAQTFELLILLVLSLAFGTKPVTLPFAMFSVTVVLVAFNTVMTSQYFIWFLSLLPLVVHSFKMSLTKALMLVLLWLGSQGIWLYFAYYLEFQCEDVFIHLWMAGISFFAAQIYILAQLIRCYDPNYGFGLMTSHSE
ncbi:GPI mannosyltransferase 1 [Aricia agestis]|uniref:GPI mannosyltransferase 1 n=1 Tax=Aricia agestis TaxID=91739 RepID=UPI001C209C9B|nr:GPI mannosyltransferase 1 [Aricia agestis]